MLVIPALLIWALFQCYQLGNCDNIPCLGQNFFYSGFCYRYVYQQTNYWNARDSCLICGGQLANFSDNSQLSFMRSSQNQNGRYWWVGPDITGKETLCYSLWSNQNIVQWSCDQQFGFICRTKDDGDACVPNTSPTTQTSTTTPVVTTQKVHVQRKHYARSARIIPLTGIDVPDLIQMASKLVNKPLLGGHNLTNLLLRINSWMEDEDDTNTTQLNSTLSLLNQLTGILRLPEISSTEFFSNLSIVVYFGVNNVIQTALHSCQATWTTDEKQSITIFALDVLNRLQLAMLSNFTRELVLQTPLFSMLLTSLNSSGVGNMALSIPGQLVSVVFPSQSALSELLSQLSSFKVQLMSFTQNPFVGDKSLNITGPVVGLSMVSGEEMNVHNLTDNFQIFLPQNISIKTEDFQITADKGLQLSLMPPDSNGSLVVIVSVTHGVQLDLYQGQKKVEKGELSQGSDKDSYTWILSPNMFLNFSTQKFLIAPNSSRINNLHLGVSTFTAHCTYWNSSLQKWDSEGCSVGPRTSPASVQCLCNHLTFFGSSFLVLPVQIDVTRTAEYFSRITENPVIVILVACFYACYIVAVIWAWRMDRRDKVQNQLLRPPDNDPCGLYRYLITVYTGASTSAKVYLSIGGLHGQFGPIRLSETKREVFKRGRVDVFLLSLPYPLGELKSITLSHDGTGPQNRWYVTRATVQDVQLKKYWHFFCNAWLDKPAKGDTSSKTFTAADDQELRSFRNIFLKKTIRGLRDEHIWISVINHPARSVFTRVQRVSCCMCLLLCTTVINLMFWEMPQDTYPIIISIGGFSLSWKDIMIAVESALLMFPVNLLIIYIFRNTRPKEKKSDDKKNKQTGNAKKGPSRPQNLATVLEELSALARTLNQTSWNTMKVDLNQASSPDFTALLQTISQLMQKQMPSGPLSVTVPLAQLSNEDLHALFCANYVFRKLKKVCADLRHLGNQPGLDKQQYEEFTTQLQALINDLDRSVPPVPIQRSTQKKEVKKKRLPWWFLYIGWFILVSISIISSYFTMMYGFLYGKQSSIRWIISMALSLFQSIFILQPLKVVGFAVFFALVLKRVDEDEEDLLDGEYESTDENQTFDETAL